MSTLGAHLRGILGINDLDQHACLFSFIGDKLPQLIESPRPHAVALRLAKPYPLTDAFEVFQGYAAPGVFGLRNESLRDDMIGIATKACFAVRNAFELLADALASSVISGQVRCRLKGLFERLALDPDSLNILAGTKFAVGVGGKVLDAKVNTKEVIGITRRLGFVLNGGHEEPRTLFASHQFGKLSRLRKIRSISVVLALGEALY